MFIVTPVRLYRDGIAHFLRSSSEFVVLGTAAESATTIPIASELRPDIVLLDMALDNSRATSRALRTALPHTPIVALAVTESEGHVLGCVEAGVSAYVPRDASLHELIATARDAIRGEATCPPRIAAGLFRRVAALSASNERDDSPRDEPLTRREGEVLALIEHGLSNKQIARRLSIAVPTVKNHVHSILEKLGATSRGNAVAKARSFHLSPSEAMTLSSAPAHPQAPASRLRSSA